MPITFQTFQSLGGDGRFTGFRSGLLAWPQWARALLMVPMIPGILLLALSIVVFVVSLLALFVLTAPVYMLLARVFNESKQDVPQRSPGAKRVDAVVRDA